MYHGYLKICTVHFCKDSLNKCIVHIFRSVTSQNVLYIYATSPPIKGVGVVLSVFSTGPTWDKHATSSSKSRPASMYVVAKNKMSSAKRRSKRVGPLSPSNSTQNTPQALIDALAFSIALMRFPRISGVFPQASRLLAPQRFAQVNSKPTNRATPHAHSHF